MRLSLGIVSACLVMVAACSKDSNHPAEPSGSGSSAPPAAVSTTAPPMNYQVKRGDTLSSIAKRFGVGVEAIVAANQLTSRDQLTEGQVLVIPPPTPVGLALSPSDGHPGTSIQFKLTGAHQAETITFEVDSPTGSKFTGPPHTAADDGSVTAQYQTTPQNPPGTYTVTAKGSGGTSAQATFRLNPPTSSSPAN